MFRITHFTLIFLLASPCAFASERSMQAGAQMMLKIAAAELLEELTESKIPRGDLLRFAEGMTEKYPELYTLSDEQAERLLADEPTVARGSFDRELELFSNSGHTPPDLLVLILDKKQADSLSPGQTAFAYQYLESLNRHLVERSVGKSLEQ